jgi:hypothetical protein
MDPATQRLALIAAGLGSILVVVIGGWSMTGHRNTAVPVVQADSHPVRVKPQNPGGMQVAGANEDIMSGGTDTNDGKLAPPPEAPAPQALRAPPAIVAAPAPTPVVAAIPAAPKPVTAAVVSATPKPVVEKPIASPDKRVAAPAPDRTTPAEKGTFVQLAAVSSEETAKAEWQRLEKRMPDLLGHRQPAISKIDLDGHTLWRVRTGGFHAVSEATVFCERVRAKGTGCSVAGF